jgi:hypothetical protein
MGPKKAVFAGVEVTYTCPLRNLGRLSVNFQNGQEFGYCFTLHHKILHSFFFLVIEKNVPVEGYLLGKSLKKHKPRKKLLI